MDASTNIMELQHQIKYAKVAKQYKQAQALEDELHRLKHLQEDQQMQDLLQQQAHELLACDTGHEGDVHQMMEAWSGTLLELHHQLQQVEQQMLLRHEDETAALLATQAAYPARPKFSPALLNMRHIERSLAEQKEFDKAHQVRKQADELEQMELNQMYSDRAARIEVEQLRLVAQQGREAEATAKKAKSAVLAAQQRQEYEAEQLTRRFQAVKLALTRTHATQRISLQQNLRGSLGLKKPSKLLWLPSLNSSLTETRGLVPEPVQKPASRQASAGPISPTIRAAGGSRCASPVQELDRMLGTYSPAGNGRCRSPLGNPDRSPTASPTGSSKKSSIACCNPERAMQFDPYEHGSPAVSAGLAVNGVRDPSPARTQRKTAAAADAAAAAAGLGLSMSSSAATRARLGSAKAGKPAVNSNNDTRPHNRPNSGSLIAGTPALTAASAISSACIPTARPETRTAARQSSPPRRQVCSQSTHAFAPAGITTNTTSTEHSGTPAIVALRPTTRHGPVGTAAPAISSNDSIHSNISGLEPWPSTPSALPQQHSAEEQRIHGALEHTAPSLVTTNSKGAGAASATGSIGSTVVSHLPSGNNQLELHEPGSDQGPHSSDSASVDSASAKVASLLSTPGGAHTAAAAAIDHHAAASSSNGACDQGQKPSSEAEQGPAAAVAEQPQEVPCSDEHSQHLQTEPQPRDIAAGPASQAPPESLGPIRLLNGRI